MKIPKTKAMIMFYVLAIAAVLAGCTVMDGNGLSKQTSQSSQVTSQSSQGISAGAAAGSVEGSVVINAVTSADYSKADLTEAVADGDTIYIGLEGDS